MSRSQLLKDLLNGKSSLEDILYRLKVILVDLGNEPIIKWVNGELQGYKDKSSAPNYRMISGEPMGTFIVNGNAQYSNARIPLLALLKKEEVDELLSQYITDGIGTLEELLKNDNLQYGQNIPTEYCHSISKLEVQIVSMQIRVPSNYIRGIITSVKNKLIDVLIELENQFDNLDDFDIKDQIDDDLKREQVVYNIHQIIFDGSINLGDKNKINKSKIGNLFGGKKQ